LEIVTTGFDNASIFGIVSINYDIPAKKGPRKNRAHPRIPHKKTPARVVAIITTTLAGAFYLGR
jgi:hypothetical protein